MDKRTGTRGKAKSPWCPFLTCPAFFLANELYRALSVDYLTASSSGRDPVGVAESILGLTSGDLTIETFAERFPDPQITADSTLWDNSTAMFSLHSAQCRLIASQML
jgi:hypothetical protein